MKEVHMMKQIEKKVPIKHSCGHAEIMTLRGNTADQILRKQYAEETHPCYACRVEQDTKEAIEMGWPAITEGTARMRHWAYCIREKFMAHRISAAPTPVSPTYQQETLSALSHVDAGWWIANRESLNAGMLPSGK